MGANVKRIEISEGLFLKTVKDAYKPIIELDVCGINNVLDIERDVKEKTLSKSNYSLIDNIILKDIIDKPEFSFLNKDIIVSLSVNAKASLYEYMLLTLFSIEDVKKLHSEFAGFVFFLQYISVYELGSIGFMSYKNWVEGFDGAQDTVFKFKTKGQFKYVCSLDSEMIVKLLRRVDIIDCGSNDGRFPSVVTDILFNNKDLLKVRVVNTPTL